MIRLEIVKQPTPALLEGMNRLLPQLSSTAPVVSDSYLAALLATQGVDLMVAIDDEQVVAMVTLVSFKIPSGVRGWIEDVIVDEHFRGRGVGRQLMIGAIEEFKRNGVRTIDLTSRESRTAANAMYRDLGFQLRETNVYRYSFED
jgi:ribosomal protein S18 acetylase RimI-like enzyme